MNYEDIIAELKECEGDYSQADKYTFRDAREAIVGLIAKLKAAEIDVDEYHQVAMNHIHANEALREKLKVAEEALEFCSGTSYITDARDAAEEALNKIRGE